MLTRPFLLLRSRQMANIGPHLKSIPGKKGKQCSICRQEFPPDAKPSVGKAFANHAREKHGAGVKTKQASSCVSNGDVA